MNARAELVSEIMHSKYVMSLLQFLGGIKLRRSAVIYESTNLVKRLASLIVIVWNESSNHECLSSNLLPLISWLSVVLGVDIEKLLRGLSTTSTVLPWRKHAVFIKSKLSYFEPLTTEVKQGML
jgi:hypothetical protein